MHTYVFKRSCANDDHMQDKPKALSRKVNKAGRGARVYPSTYGDIIKIQNATLSLSTASGPSS